MEEILRRLLKELHFPLGGYDDVTDTLWMIESRQNKIIATRTETGFTCMEGHGEVLQVETLEQLESLFLNYFKGNGFIIEGSNR